MTRDRGVLYGRAPTCPCGKAYYPDKRSAREAHDHLHQPGTPVRYYQCAHGGWHYTRQTTRLTTPRARI